MFDVIIIGAGPTGCTAARKLACNGYKVLLVEKFKMPRNKSCSGIFIKKSMNLVRQYFGEDAPDFTMCAPTDNRGMIFTSDKGHEYRFEQEGLNIWRSSFDYWLATKAAETGAELRDVQAITNIPCVRNRGRSSKLIRSYDPSLSSKEAILIITKAGHANQNHFRSTIWPMHDLF